MGKQSNSWFWGVNLVATIIPQCISSRMYISWESEYRHHLSASLLAINNVVVFDRALQFSIEILYN